MKPNGPLRVHLVSIYALKIMAKHLHYLIYKKSTQLETVEELIINVCLHGIVDKMQSNDNKIFDALGLRG